MTRKLSLLVLLAAGILPVASTLAQQNDAPLPPTEAEQKQVVADIKAKALDFEKNLPDFVCTQLSHHSIDPKGFNQWKMLETVNEQLLFTNRQEHYKLMAVNGKKAGENEKPPGNPIRVSEFINLVHAIFDPSAKTDMAWTNWDSVRGHRVHLITFLTKKENTHFTVGRSKGVDAGMAGFIYADADTSAVLRIAVAATEIPAHHAIQNVSYDVNYEFARVGDKVYLLPLKADVRQKEGKGQIWDEMELKDFRRP